MKATHKFLVFNDQRELKMRLNCEVSIVNRLGPSFSMRNSSKPARASLAIGRKESSKIAAGTAEKTVFLLVCTAKDKNGARYKVCTTLIYVNPLLSSPGDLFFSSTFEGGGLFNLAKRINGSKVSRGRTCGYRTLYCFF